MKIIQAMGLERKLKAYKVLQSLIKVADLSFGFCNVLRIAVIRRCDDILFSQNERER